jgi:primase-polymerase (primpol)-like protein/ribosomal protein L37AE/L43A
MVASAPLPWLPVIPDAIPRQLTDGRAWYPAIIRPKKNKPGKWDKIPGDPSTGQPATWSDPETRCTFGDAFMAYEAGRFGGIGYLMDADAGIIGIDLDDSITEDGSIKPWAQEIVDGFPGAHWERSISGKGLRGFCLGTLPVGGCRSKIEGCSVELYGDERFLVVTGQALDYVDDLPTLQDAVDALHARLTAGRVRATGTAVASGLTGRVTDLSPDELGILEDAFGSRFGARLADIYMRDELDAAGASEDDWALESELAWQAIGRGYEGDALHLVVERIMRYGPYRRKWDEARGAVSWLAQDVANAVETTQERRKKYQNGPEFEWGNASDVPTDETPEQTIARLQCDLARERSLRAQDQITIRVQRERLTELREQIAGWKIVLSNPKLKPVDRIAALPVIEDVRAAQKIGQEEIHVRYPGIVKSWGIPESTLGKSVAVLTEMAGAPLAKRNEPDNYQIIVDSPKRGAVTVTPQKTIISAVAEGNLYAAVGAYDPCLPRRGGKREPLPRCEDHPDADLVIRSVTQCATCRKPLAPGQDRTLRRQNDGVGEGTDPLVIDGTYCPQNDGVGGHDGAEQAEAEANVIPMASRTVQHRAHVEVCQEAKRQDLDILGICPECRVYTAKRRRAGIWGCAGCSAVLYVEPWAEAPPELQVAGAEVAHDD